MTAPWVDGEAITAAKMYTRVTVPMPSTGAASGTTNSTGYATITHGLSYTPSAVWVQNLGAIAPTAAWLPGQVLSITSTTFQVRFMSLNNTGSPYAIVVAASLPFNVSWLAVR